MSTGPITAGRNEEKVDGDPNTETKQEDSSPGRKAAQTCPRNPSRWRKAVNKLKSTGQTRKDSKGKAPDATPPPPDAPQPNANSQAESLIGLINGDLEHMRGEAGALKDYNDQLTRELGLLEEIFEGIKKDTNSGKEKVDQLNRLRKKLMKVKLAIPSKYQIGAEKNEHDKNLQFIYEFERSIRGEESKKIPQLHGSRLFNTSMEFKDFEARYDELDAHVKLCLLCFSIFPQGATIKKRLMLQWWVVEGYASTKKDAEAKFEELLEKGFIEPVNGNRSHPVGSCRIHRFHRSALVALAERAKLFNFGSGGDPTQSFSGSFQACLMGMGLISYDDFKDKDKETKERDPVKVIKERIQELEKLHLLVNVDEHILEFIDDWFGKMKNLNFLYLGRWKALATHHIEVEDPKFLEKLGNMKYLKFLSLQGVSNIIAIPKSTLKLTNLDVLDLRACSNLESIPESIGNYLQKLTHLDMSECYLLAHMPKSLSYLSKLKVLKGFFVGQDNNKSCTLGDLKKLEVLEKLCIYTDQEDFPRPKHVEDMEKLKALTKLTITWGVNNKGDKKSLETEKEKTEGSAKLPPQLKTEKEKEKTQGSAKSLETDKKKTEGSAKSLETEKEKTEGSSKLPPKLEKLDLKCFPKKDTPNWLKLENLEGDKLKKLYIRGGKLRDVGQYQGIGDASESRKEWKVEVLRLKYLGEIEMEWRQLQGLFPKLKYLEKVGCPNLTLFPCDAKGVWIKP